MSRVSCVIASADYRKLRLEPSRSRPHSVRRSISPYSLRGKEKPYVATPLGWDEVEEGAEDPDALEQFRFDQVLARVEEYGDLFA